MSSLPLLNLPLLAFREIADNWNPLEILNFSLISKRTKRIAKSISKTASEIYFTDWPSISITIQFPDNTSEKWYYSYTISKTLFFHDDYVNHVYSRYSQIGSEDPIQKTLDLLDHSLEVFKISVFNVRSDLFDFNRCHFMNSKWRIGKLRASSDQPEEAELFFKTFRTEIDYLDLFLDFEEPFKLKKEITWPKKSSFLLQKHGSFNILKSINSEELIINQNLSTNKDVNSFLKSWISGKTNSNLRRAHFITNFENENEIFLSKVLKRIKFNHRDPRLVKREFKLNNDSYSIMGGIDINGPNGKTATIDWTNWGGVERNDELRRIDDYERFQRDNSFKGMRDIASFSLFIWGLENQIGEC